MSLGLKQEFYSAIMDILIIGKQDKNANGEIHFLQYISFNLSYHHRFSTRESVHIPSSHSKGDLVDFEILDFPPCGNYTRDIIESCRDNVFL